ncbi:WD40-repeat-containing domain protein [Mycena sp. CBHHK59/15]|nr:WD40-repeat-containing domain protein [Mycena sp. CBHHK59/15]
MATSAPKLNKDNLLNSVIIALTASKAAVTGLGVPGVEPVINGVLQLATMLSTMKANKKDFRGLELSITTLVTDIDASGTTGASGDLQDRLIKLSSKFTALAADCRSHADKSSFKRFWKSNDYKDDILRIKNLAASHIQEFTFHGNISVEKLVADMVSKVSVVDEKVDAVAATAILAQLKYVPARYNAENTAERCMDGTRVDLIHDILAQLAGPPNLSSRVVMLCGPAGSGKSTVAKTIASRLAEERGLLAASFFFSRDYAERKEIRFLASTLACQLADYNEDFRRLLVKLLQNDRERLLSADPHLQFKKLFVELLAQMPPSPTSWVICLDALDECGKDRGQVLLRWLSDNIHEIPVHVRFLLTGRPDVPSYLKLSPLLSLMHKWSIDEIDSDTVNSDIRQYVIRSLDGHTWAAREDWTVQDHDAEEITSRASGLFIFAATAVRYIRAGLPQEQPQSSVDFLLRGTPLNDLYDLYHRVIDEAVPFPVDDRTRKYRERSKRVLGTILHLVEPLGVQSLAGLLDMNVEELRRTLLPLSAVVRVPEATGEAIKIIHLSFREFMTSGVQGTRPDLLCGTEDQQCSVVFDTLRVMQKDLKFNICDLPTSYLRNVDIADLKGRKEKYIPAHLAYSCCFWADHLASTRYNPELAQVTGEFLFGRFLFWLEVLSFLETVGYAPRALSKLITWIGEDPTIVQFASDAKRFISFFGDVIVQSAPHIYLSALAFAPQQSEIVKKFRHEFPCLLSAEIGQMAVWPATIAVLEGHTGVVTSVAFSPDGKHIVSGSEDNTVRVWDSESGEVVAGPFEGHTSWVTSVAFSPDGKCIVSGSWDNTVRVWDSESGEAVAGPFKCHTSPVTSVAFSPDGKHIVSGSEDNTMRVWDSESGEVVAGPFEGHTHFVTSVAFSPDGKHIVSGSEDHTVRIWDSESGEVVAGPFEGHTSLVTSVAFSPDGRHIVSGSEDNTVRVWDSESGVVIAGPFEGHTSSVTSVVFSPDGKHIVSGSWDNTVRVWDSESGEVVAGPFEGHTSLVTSVAFSPDGRHIVSGSEDNTVRVWDSESGVVIAGPFEGHTSSVTSVVFSPDGKHIVSGSWDNTVRVWDSESGEVVAGPFEGHTSLVTSVAFSPDGRHIVSGSEDNTVRVWDSESGVVIAGPFEGHTSSVTSVVFSPDGKHIVSGSWDNTVRVWDSESGEVVAGPFEDHTGSITSVVFSPDGKRIISGSEDKTVRVWDSESGQVVAGPFEGHTSFVTSVAFSPDGKHIVSGSTDNTVRLWDSESGEVIAVPFEGHINSVTSVAFSPDGKHIVSGSWDRTVRVWDSESGEVVAGSFDGHSDRVTSVVFSPDGKHIVSGSRNHSAHAWLLSLRTTPPFVPPPRWEIRQGWVSCRPSELLFWLPSPYRIGLWSPHNTLVIGKQQTVLAYDDFVHGPEWKQCYSVPA